TDHIDLQVTPLGRVIALCEDGGRLVRGARLGEQLGLVPDDAHTQPACAVVWLDDERSLIQQRRQQIGLRNDVRGGHRGPRSPQNARGNHLVADRDRHGIWIHHGGALRMQDSRQTHRDPGDLLQHVQVVLHPYRREVDEASVGSDVRSGCETTYVAGIGAPAAPRMRAAITLSRIATVTGYGFTMAAPCACRTPARLIEIPEICFSTYRSCSTRTVERSMRRPLAAMTSTTTPASASACMAFGKMLTWPAP